MEPVIVPVPAHVPPVGAVQGLCRGHGEEWVGMGALTLTLYSPLPLWGVQGGTVRG